MQTFAHSRRSLPMVKVSSRPPTMMARHRTHLLVQQILIRFKINPMDLPLLLNRSPLSSKISEEKLLVWVRKSKQLWRKWSEDSKKKMISNCKSSQIVMALFLQCQLTCIQQFKVIKLILRTFSNNKEILNLVFWFLILLLPIHLRHLRVLKDKGSTFSVTNSIWPFKIWPQKFLCKVQIHNN